jgi:hypothetical protein
MEAFMAERIPVNQPDVAPAAGRPLHQPDCRSEIPLAHFGRGGSKQELARPYVERAEREGRFGVVLRLRHSPLL